MAQFSIREAVRFSVSSYARHIVMCLTAGVIIGASLFLAYVGPRFTAQKLGVYQMAVVEATSTMDPSLAQGTDQSKMALQKVQEITTRVVTHIQNAPKHYLLLVFLVAVAVWLLYMFLVIGMAKLALALRDKDKGSLAILFEGGSVLWKWIAASMLFGLYFLCMFLGAAVLTIPFAYICHALIKSDQATAVVTLSVWVALLLAILFWAASYMFFGYCLLDGKAKGAREALRVSQTLARDHRAKIVVALVVMISILAGITVLVKQILLFSGDALEDVYFRNSVAALFTASFASLYLASIYRSLTR